MKCLDDCHNYELDGFLGETSYVRFYRLKANGEKVEGVTNEEVLRMLIHRVQYLNEEYGNPPGKFLCRENSIAITKLQEALMWLEARTADRVKRSVEGKMEP